MFDSDCSTFCFTPSFPSDKTCLAAFPGWSRLLMIAGKKSTNRRCQGSLSKHLMSHLDQPVKIVKTRMLFWAAYLALVLEASHPSMCSQKFVLLHLSLAAGSHTNRLNRFVGYVGFILGWPGSTWPMASIWCSDCCRNSGGNAAAAVSSRLLKWFSLSWIWQHDNIVLKVWASKAFVGRFDGLIFRKRWFLQSPYLILYKIESLCPYKI